jgi:thiol-disulfide isomerase/thioredoxin
VPPKQKRSAKEKEPRGEKKEQPTSQPSAQWTPPSEGSLGPNGNASVGIGAPRGLKEGAPAPQPWQHQTLPTPQGTTDTTKIAGTEIASNPPVADWRPNGPSPIKAPAGPPAFPSDSPARVPSCVLVGSQLYNFALNDTQGRPWEFKKQRRGKVILLDFWFTTCRPCINTVHHLKRLQQQYGPEGLEVIGIANEGAGTIQDQARRVNLFAQVQRINYQLLLSGGSDCPVIRQFGVTNYPTLLLLDESGRIHRRYVGEPDRRTLDELEWEIQRLLKHP